MSEPKILMCTLRDAITPNDLEEIHIECRFEDGQKLAAVVINSDFPILAETIKKFLNQLGRSVAIANIKKIE